MLNALSGEYYDLCFKFVIHKEICESQIARSRPVARAGVFLIIFNAPKVHGERDVPRVRGEYPRIRATRASEGLRV